jgi:arginase
MPAVDHRLAGGLSWGELEAVVRLARASGDLRGLEITIFNPALDTDGTIANALVNCLLAALEDHHAS